MARKYGEVPAHLQFATKFTREGELDMRNRKPFRSQALKAQARRQAHQGKDGVWRSPVRTLMHSD